MLAARLETRLLRTLEIDPRSHPRGQAYLSAASGMVCAHDRVYVVSDDEHHLAVFRDRRAPGTLHRLFDGDLPEPKKARKRLKPDLETLLLMPASRASPRSRLLALGSGSRANRSRGVVIAPGEDGEPSMMAKLFDLEPLYRPLRALLGEINIEGAMLIGDEFVLLNRGVAGHSDNAVARYRASDLSSVIAGWREDIQPVSIRPYSLGAIDGVPLAFTDAAALPDGSWVFTAVAENTTDAYADGRCFGSAVGVVSAQGDLISVRRLTGRAKVEGIALQRSAVTTTLCMVTDADDPAQASRLLLAQL